MSNLLRPTIIHEPDAPSLELAGVSVSYERMPALDDVSLRLRRGDRVAIVGPNGAGKSTLFNVVAGVLKPDRGAVRIYGSDPAGHVCVGYVPQRSRIDLRFPATVWDVVMMGRVRQIGLFRWPGRRDAVIVRRALRQVGMEEFGKRHIGELSGGQQQRVLLARALAQGAELLLMDEPLTGLDAPSQRAILEILDRLTAEGVTETKVTLVMIPAARFDALMASSKAGFTSSGGRASGRLQNMHGRIKNRLGAHGVGGAEQAARAVERAAGAGVFVLA